MTDSITCLWCKKEAPKTRKNRKFCSQACRVSYFLASRERRNALKIIEQIDTLLAELRTKYS